MPVCVAPVTVAADVLIEVTTDVASPDVDMTTGVFVNAVGKVYDAVPSNAFKNITTFL